MSQYQRIACLSTESVETLYALGESARIVGMSFAMLGGSASTG